MILRKSQLGFFAIGMVLLALILWYGYEIERAPIAVPILQKDGTIGAEFGGQSRFLATLTRPLFDRPGLFLTFFHPNEIGSAKIGSSQSDDPRDVIVFHCPPGSTIRASDVFARFQNVSENMWLWGPYVGSTGPGGPDQDEGGRLQRWVEVGRPAIHPDHPNNVFPDRNNGPGNKFGGRAAGFSFVSPNYILPTSGGRYVASADPPPGSYNKVRCTRVVVCGDEWLDQPEESCDDGNTVSGDGCSATCQLEVCGNGIVDPGESCDDGNTSNTDACRNGCVPNVCGDGFVNVGTEKCDDGTTCMGLDGNGNPIGDGSWCTTNADCLSQPATSCANHFTPAQIPAGSSGDGCRNNCTQEDGAVCILTEDRNPGVPERSLCTFGAPSPTPPPPPPTGPLPPP